MKGQKCNSSIGNADGFLFSGVFLVGVCALVMFTPEVVMPAPAVGASGVMVSFPSLKAADVPAKISSVNVPGMWQAPPTLMAAIGWGFANACASPVLVSESPVPALKVCVFDTVCP